MSEPDLGWAWFESKSPPSDHETSTVDHDLASTFARCFRGEDGVTALKHLRKITHQRILGPCASDALLRHMEGQRQLVSHLIALVQHGQDDGRAGDILPTQNDLAILENSHD